MIWCVDDDRTIRDIEVYTLEQTGFQARGFADGPSMLKALDAEIPDLIILDIMMPEMDGTEVLKNLRSKTFRSSWQLPKERKWTRSSV